MKEYAIVRTTRVVGNDVRAILTEDCFEIFDDGYQSFELALLKRSEYEYPNHFIVIEYYK